MFVFPYKCSNVCIQLDLVATHFSLLHWKVSSFYFHQFFLLIKLSPTFWSFLLLFYNVPFNFNVS